MYRARYRSPSGCGDLQNHNRRCNRVNKRNNEQTEKIKRKRKERWLDEFRACSSSPETNGWEIEKKNNEKFKI